MCDSPLIGIKYGVDPDTGKNRIKLKRRIDFSYQDYCNRYGKENVLLIPCGHCAACILARRKEWSIRCQVEALYHEKNCFITLTYDDAHLAHNMDVLKKDLKKFIKSVRNCGHKVRYFGCGERGEHGSRRLHAHIILFGWMPDDMMYDGCSQSGEALFTSKLVDDLWAKGRCTVQFFDGSVGSYVAGYTSKKLGDREGFQIQSTRPGIGYQFALNHLDSVIKYNALFVPFHGNSAVPRYFEKIYSDAGYSFLLDLIKEERFNQSLSLKYDEARKHGFNHLDQQVVYMRSIHNRLLANKVRTL